MCFWCDKYLYEFVNSVVFFNKVFCDYVYLIKLFDNIKLFFGDLLIKIIRIWEGGKLIW